MPLNRADVAMLNDSIRGVGDSFRTTRLDAEAKQRAMDEKVLRQTMADNTKQHYKNTEDNNKLAQAFRELSAHSKRISDSINWLGEQARAKTAKGEDGDGWARQQFDDAIEEAGPNLAPQLRSQFKMFSDPGFSFSAAGAPKQPGEMKTATIADTEKEFELEEAAKSGDPAATRKLEIFKANKANKASGEFDTVTEHYDEKPADVTPAKGEWNPFVANTPAVTNAPAIPKHDVVRKIPRGAPAFGVPSLGQLPLPPASMGASPQQSSLAPTSAASPQAGTNAPAASVPKLQNQADIDYALKDANDAINGTGNYKGRRVSRAAVEARLKAMGITLKE
jgi:hypothetical protein